MHKPAGALMSETAQRVEQRREPRRTAGGDILLWHGEGAGQARGKLMDRSTSGFRAEHDAPGLTCGQLVRFHASTSFKGTARVVWTRISGGRVESGFLIIP